MIKRNPNAIAEVTFEANAKREIVHYWNDKMRQNPIRPEYKGRIDQQKVDCIHLAHVGDDWFGVYMLDWITLSKPIPYMFTVSYSAKNREIKTDCYVMVGELKAPIEARRPSAVFPEAGFHSRRREEEDDIFEELFPYGD